MYRSIVYLLIKENLYIKSYLSGSKIGKKIGNQRIHTGGLMCGGLIRGVTQVNKITVNKVIIELFYLITSSAKLRPTLRIVTPASQAIQLQNRLVT